MRINDIEIFFEENVAKKTITELSFDGTNNVSLIQTLTQSFDFDNLFIPEITNDTLKTSDTLYFKDNKIIFVEFKRGGKIREQQFRLKATESVLIFYNYIHSKNFTEPLTLPNNFIEIYFVYDKDKVAMSALPFFSNTKRKLKLLYKHLISDYHIIDNNEFKNIFEIV